MDRSRILGWATQLIQAWRETDGLQLLVAGRWVIYLSLIGVAGYSVAGTVNSVVAAKITVVPRAEPSSQAMAAAHRALPRPQPYVAMAARNLMAAAREDLSPSPEEPAPESEAVSGADFAEEELEPCTLAAELRATVIPEERPMLAMALFYDTRARESDLYSLRTGDNEIASDAALVDIRRRAVVVRRADHFELCEAAPVGKKRRAKSPPRRRPSAVGSSAAGSEGIEMKSATSYVIDEEVIDDALTNLSKLATQARIVPSFKNGKPNGFKVFSIRSKSLFKKIGLRNGDVIKSINGYEMTSPDKALELYQKLKDAHDVTVDLTRRGRNVTMSYAIR